jgi:hypothetical protein
MVPAFRLLAMSPKQATQLWSKEFWVLEQMPLMSFKKTVAKIDPVVQDRYTLLGYQTADHVLMMAPHEEIEIFKTAREHLVPSAVVEMKKHFRQVIPLPLPKADLLAEERMFKGDGQFCLAYVGRFPRSGANLDKIYEVMTKSWIMRKGESVRLLCMSNTGGGTMPPPKHMEVKIAGREEFWHTAREEMHLIVMMHEDAEFHMSLMEPMSFGVPAVLLEKPWAVSLLGPDYPFYAKGVVQAYAIVKQFYDDYAGTYAKFRDWHVNWFQPTYERRYAKDMMYPVLDSFLADYEAKNTRQLVSSSVSTGDIVQLLAQSGDELLIKDGAKKLSQEGKIVLQSTHFDPDVYNKLATTWSLSWNSYRLGLKALGYVDASTTTGHMRRVKS